MNDNRVGVACAFRHNPEDGRFIQAFELSPSPNGKERPVPMIGYLAVATPKKTYWSFVRYEPPFVWPKGHPNASKGRAAEMATCRVADYDCQDCGKRSKGVYRNAKGCFCPECGGRRCSAEPIKDGGPEFMSMVGNELADEIETAAVNALKDDQSPPFQFPVLMAGGLGLEPDGALPPDALGAAAARGRGLRAVAHMSLEELADVIEGDLSIVSGPSSGFAEYDALREGVGWESGAVRFWLKPWLPEPDRGPVRFRSIKY